MINDIYSFINTNENQSLLSSLNLNRDLLECNKFHSFLSNELALKETTIKVSSELYFKSKKHLLKNIFQNSSSVDEMAINLASIYAKIFAEYAHNYGYNNTDSLRKSIYKLQYKISKIQLTESINKYAQLN